MKFSTKAMITATMMLLVALSPLLVALSPLLGQQQNRDVTFRITLSEWYDIFISHTTITFTDRPPQIIASPSGIQISANENPVQVRVFAIKVPSSGLRLTVTANSNFHPTILASTVSWTVFSGSGYVPGRLQVGTGITVGNWSAGSILHWHVGALNFFFDRDYVNQVPGTHSITATFTLSSP